MAHIYDAKQAKILIRMILEEYIPEFQRLLEGIEAIYGKELEHI